MTRRQCAEAGHAYERSKDEPPDTQADANGCPAAMSAQACKQAGEAVRQGEGGSHIVAPGECPKAMTQQQCAEAARAYEEATR
jgi:hypothetical protein